MAHHKLLIHISDRDKWAVAVKMASASVASVAPGELEVVIVADVFAGAVCLACDRKLRSEMEAFCAAGHQILACEESLRNLNMRPENLPDFIGRVPSSLMKIVALQDAGFHYIKI